MQHQRDCLTPGYKYVYIHAHVHNYCACCRGICTWKITYNIISTLNRKKEEERKEEKETNNKDVHVYTPIFLSRWGCSPKTKLYFSKLLWILVCFIVCDSFFSVLFFLSLWCTWLFIHVYKLRQQTARRSDLSLTALDSQVWILDLVGGFKACPSAIVHKQVHVHVLQSHYRVQKQNTIIQVCAFTHLHIALTEIKIKLSSWNVQLQ